jgi:hypothetical protein
MSQRRTWEVRLPGGLLVNVEAINVAVLTNGALVFDCPGAWRNEDGPVTADRGWADGQWISFHPVPLREQAIEQ